MECEYCFHLNLNLNIETKNLPKYEIFDNCIQLPQTKDILTKDEDDSSLILCFDISGSMETRYTLDNNLTKKYGKREISRIDMVKSAMENILDSLLKKSPKVKVGLVSFGTNVEAKGDCLSKSIILDCLNNEAKIKEI